MSNPKAHGCRVLAASVGSAQEPPRKLGGSLALPKSAILLLFIPSSRSRTIALKLAIIGLGNIVNAHVEGVRVYNLGCAADDRITITGLVDRDPARAKTWRDKIAADQELASQPATLDDYRHLLEPAHRPDLISVLLPHHLHLETARLFLEAGIALQMQKPISLGMRDGLEMIEIAKKTGTPMVVSEQFVLGRKQRLELEWLRSGRQIGKPRLMIDHTTIAVEYQMNTPWRRQRGAAGGGMFLDFGVHRTHWMIDAFGPCDTAYAHTGAFAAASEGGADIEDFGAAVLRFTSGLVCELTILTPPRGQEYYHRQLWGEHGTWCENTCTLADGKSVARDLHESTVPASVPNDAFAHSYQELIARMRNPAAPVIGEPARALEALAVIFACLESAHIGAPVRVADILSGKAGEYENTVWQAREKME